MKLKLLNNSKLSNSLTIFFLFFSFELTPGGLHGFFFVFFVLRKIALLLLTFSELAWLEFRPVIVFDLPGFEEVIARDGGPLFVLPT